MEILLTILQFLIDYNLLGYSFALGIIIVLVSVSVRILKPISLETKTWLSLILTGLLFMGLSYSAYIINETASPQARGLQQRYHLVGYELGWLGGEANSFDETSIFWTKVTRIDVSGKQVEMNFDWKKGKLSGSFEGNSFKGTWIQENGRGQFEMTFSPDFSSAMGWWNDGPGTEYHEMYIR